MRRVIPVSDARRSRRLPLSAAAEIRCRGERHDVVAEDVGQDGCRIASRFPFRRGEAVYVTVHLQGTSAPISSTATVVWSTTSAPHHAGLSFARTGAPERLRRIRELLQREPALARAPAPLRPGQRLRLGPLPGPGLFLGRNELAVLRAARDGGTALGLLAAAGPRFREVRAALEALRARGLVHERPADPVPPGWAVVLGADEAAAPGPEPVANPLAPAPRPHRASCFLEMAREEGALGHLGAAVEWLQAALEAAPGDAEIAAALDALTGGAG